MITSEEAITSSRVAGKEESHKVIAEKTVLLPKYVGIACRLKE